MAIDHRSPPFPSKPPKDDVHPTYVNGHTDELVRRLEAEGVAIPHPHPGRFGPAGAK